MQAMAQVGCVERVSCLLSCRATSDEDLLKVRESLSKELFCKMNSLSDEELFMFFDKGKIFRCLEVGWCVPQNLVKDYIPIR